MNKTLRAALLMVIIACSIALQAQVSSLHIKEINGRQYYTYQVQPNETVTSIAHKLGIDSDDIVKYNPAVVDGLQAYQTLYLPVDGVKPELSTKAEGVVTHVAQKKETIYGIGKQYGVSTEELYALNPWLRDGLKAGQVIIISVNESAPATATGPAATQPSSSAAASEDPTDLPSRPGYIVYAISEGESLYGIGRAYGVTTDQILAANPSLDASNYRAGTAIYIPVADTATPATPSTDIFTTPDSDDDEEIVAQPDSVATPPADVNPVNPNADGSVSIAVILPFNLNEKKMDSAAENATEFYRGFLLAVDSLRCSSQPIHIYTFDSASNADSVRAILRRPEMLNVNAVIAPGSADHLAMIGKWGSDNGILVVNPFVVRDQSYLSNPFMAQTNIPSARMKDKAVDAVVEFYGTRTPVILRRSGGPEAHADFIDAIKERYLDLGVDIQIITYQDKLTASHLKRLDGRTDEFIFLPYESSEDEVKRILPALIEYRNGLDYPSQVMLFGYPEWVSFSDATITDLGNANTTVYSRYYRDSESIEEKMADDQFQYWYGRQPVKKFPRQAYLGIDLGMFLIRALRANGGDFNVASPWYHGIQSTYHLVSPPSGEGWANDMLYFINYRPSGIVDKIEI